MKETKENKEDLKETNGYCTTTYRLLLYQTNLEDFQKTKKLYNQILLHYLHILQQHPDFLEASNMQLMRTLELLTIGSKQQQQSGQKVAYPLHQIASKIPVYFRRAAINAAISVARSRQQQTCAWTLPHSSEAAPVYYQGMYRNFSHHTIELKVYHQTKWCWNRYSFQGRPLPSQAHTLSPSLKVGKNKVWLHVPVITIVSDIRTVTKRMQDQESFASIVFPTGSLFAVAVLFDASGKEQHPHFFRGGAKYQHERTRQAAKLTYLPSGELMESKHNRLLLEKIRRINESYAHQISRQILSYCESYGVKILVVPKYSKRFRETKYSSQATTYEWIGRKILRYLDYKAFQRGIVLTRVSRTHCLDTCSFCGASLLSQNQNLPSQHCFYFCPHGHRGNRFLNEARNLAKNFLKYYPASVKNELQWEETRVQAP